MDMDKELRVRDRHTFPVSVALRAVDLERIAIHSANHSRSAFIRRAIANELARLEDSPDAIHFDSAGFLNHHWFENGLYGMTNGGWNSNMTWAKTLDRMQGCLTSIVLDSPAKQHIPEDIMDWLQRYMRPIEEEFEILNKEDAGAFARLALHRYRELATKYGAH